MSEARSNEKKLNVTIYWDDPHIEAEAELFPVELQPLYQWLKCFVRDECKRDVDVLVERARLQKVTIDKTNWVRILKGRWRHDADGNELPSPYVSEINLRNAIVSLRDKVRVELLEGGMPFVETSVFHTIRRAIEKRMRKDRVNKWQLIVGPTGTSKTASYKELAMRNPLIKWLESSHNGSMKQFMVRLAVRCGASRSISYNQAENKIVEAMMPRAGQTKCIIIDNMQDMVSSDRKLMSLGKSVEKQPAYQFLRSLSEETGCAVIWSITPENESQMFNSESIYMEQFEGRFGGRDGLLRLPNFVPRKDLLLIAETLGFKDAQKHADLLVKISEERGRIRRFFEIMQDAKDAADADREPFTVDYLQAALAERATSQPIRK
jgi:hypothetical protein